MWRCEREMQRMAPEHRDEADPLQARLAANADEADRLHRQFQQVGLRTIAMGFDLVFDYRPMPNDPSSYARELYATLHELDAGGFDRIIVELPPDTPEWSAIRDRLFRAAAQ